MTARARVVGLNHVSLEVGFGEGDIPDLVDGTMKQQRLLATCPKTPTEDDLADIFRKSIQNW